MINVIINGDPRKISAELDIYGLLDFLELNGSPLLVEHNGTALLKSEWTTTFLRENDRVELVSIVAGG